MAAESDSATPKKRMNRRVAIVIREDVRILVSKAVLVVDAVG
jgi:hypothetical protein